MYDHTVQNGMVQEREERERVRDRGKEREVSGFGLMTPGLSKDIRCHV